MCDEKIKMEYLSLKERLEFALTCKVNYNYHFVRIARSRKFPKRKAVDKMLKIGAGHCDECGKMYCDDCDSSKCESCKMLDCCCNCKECCECGDLLNEEFYDSCKKCQKYYCGREYEHCFDENNDKCDKCKKYYCKGCDPMIECYKCEDKLCKECFEKHNCTEK